jgi:hypothetical protein
MESITRCSQDEADKQPDGELLDSWEAIVRALPKDYEKSAVTQEALLRRRGVQSAEDLLHLVFGYSVLDKSLKALGSWAMQQGIADISAAGLYQRLRDANQWVGRILFQILEQRRLDWPQGRAVSVDIRDATVISRPGSQGTDWRIHLSLDLGAMQIRGVELTDAKGGESLVRFDSGQDQIVLADRIHANRKGLASLLLVGASFAVRMTWQNLPLTDEQRQGWKVTEWLHNAFRDPQTVFQEQPAYLSINEQYYAVRVCAIRLPKEAAEKAVQRARKQAEKNGHTPDARTLLAAQFVLVVTNLAPDLWSTQQVFDLYRLRWQIELFFKRLKSILFLDHLRARKAQLAQTYLLGKLLAACLLDGISHHFIQRLPLGFHSLDRPLSPWSLTSQLWEQFQNLIRGPLSFEYLENHPIKFQRFLCCSPRKRKQQLAVAQRRLADVALSPSYAAQALS